MSDEKAVMFSRQHYNYIADALNKAMLDGVPSGEVDSAWLDGFTSAVMALAEAFEEDNVRFSYKQFFDAVNRRE